MSLPPQRVDTTHDIIYHAKHPLYEFALERSALISRDPRSQPSLVQLRFRDQPQQQGIVLPLAVLEQFHDALGRLIDYIRQERGRELANHPSASSTEGAMGISAHRDDDFTTAPLEASPLTAYLNRSISVTSLWRLSGMILIWLTALLSWALYSLWASTGDFKPLQATAAQESQPRTAASAMRHSNDAAAGLAARTAATQPPSSVASAAAKAHNDQPPHITVHIQSAAQQEAAQRLADRLQQSGYLITETAILVPKGPPRTEVRYFHPTEAEEAAAIAVLLHQSYRPPATVTYMRGRKDASQSPHRRYEVWLGPEPRSHRTVR
jgi:hypothetical protein